MPAFSPNVRLAGRVPATVTARRLAGLACMLLALPAYAQYQWRDANGRMVFSDQPPPTSVRADQVLRAEPPKPAPKAAAAEPSAAAPAAAAPAALASRAQPAQQTLADREMEFRKRQTERAEAQRKQKDEAEKTARNARACEDARSEIRTLESGVRMARINAQGEREVVDDAERTRRLDAARRDLKDVCGNG